MKPYETFDDFWHEYFTPSDAPFDTWAITKFTHTPEAEYQKLRAAGQDRLGYLPTMLTLADPLKQKQAEVMLKNLPNAHVNSLRQQYQQRFVEQLPKRFGLFHSDKKQADAIYDTWEAFANEWLERDGQSLLSYNMPLLFDHVSDLTYWGWQQKGFDPCGTQRLIVTVFQYRTSRFAEVFITNVTDADMSRISMLMQSRLTLNAEALF